MYDFSEEHILRSVDGILKRLNTEYLDILILHRPDALIEPEEVAAAFDKLEYSGKVKFFGVSNHKPSQIELLKKYVKQDILADQLQFSIPFSNMVANGLEVNMLTDGAADRDGSILDYCRLNDMTIQAWSPFQAGNGKGIFINNAIYGMTGGQMAPTTLVGMKTSTSPYGRDVHLHGYPLKIADIAAQLEGTAYVTRQSVETVPAIRKAKKAIRKAFENSMAGKGSNLVEIVSTCNSGWKMSPEKSNKWMQENMFPFYPLGDLKDKQ